MNGNDLEPTTPKVLWTPTSTDTGVDRFRRFVNKKYNLSLENYWDLHEWSINNLPEFWGEVWDQGGVIYSKPYEKVLDTTAKFEDVPQWFIGARLNYAENLLRFNDDRVAFFATGETRTKIQKITFAEVNRQVAVYASALKKCGVRPGDRVVGYITNSPPAAYTFLALASIGAMWSAVSLEFGISGVLDRLQQVQPKVLIATDYAVREGQVTNYLERLEIIVKELPSLEKVVISPLNDSPSAEEMARIPKSCLLSQFVASGRNPDGSIPRLEFTQLPSNHPLLISFTSGTTGLPKGIVHSAVGCFIPMLKDSILQNDYTRADVLEMFSTVGWAAWNMMISFLSMGCGVLLYDGSPLYPSPSRIWDLADEIGTSVMLMYPYMLDKSEKDGIKPRYTHKLDKLRMIGMGASCPKPQNWNYLHNCVKPEVYAASVLGATETMCAVATFNYCLPVHFGEIQASALGFGLDCFNDEGVSVTGEPGELVITKPFPSMPLFIWNDQNKEKYKKSYFNKFSGVWVQGDLCMINPDTRGIITLGRSDCVLNPKGRRFGSSEIYNVVEALEEIEESVCVPQYNKDGDERAILFVKIVKGCSFTNELETRIRNQIKEELTEKHCPEIILEVKDVPHTATGKKVEMAVKQAINGHTLPNKMSIVNPESLDYFYSIPELQGY